MKTFYRIIILVFVVGFITTSCEKVVSLADVNFDSTFKTDLNFDISTASFKAVNGSFLVEAQVNPQELDAEFDKYLDKIKEVSIKSARIEIISTDPSSINLLRGHLYFKGEGHEAVSWDFQNVELTEGAALELNEDAWPDIQEMLLDKIPFDVSFSGTTDVDEGSVEARLVLIVNVLANPLE